MPDGNLAMLMNLAAQQQGGPGGGGMPPGGGPPGAGAPPGGGVPSDSAAAGAAAPQAQAPNPVEMIQQGLLLFSMGAQALGMTESALKVVNDFKRSYERLMKTTGGGRQAAGMGQGMPGAQPPGVGPMPGMPMT